MRSRLCNIYRTFYSTLHKKDANRLVQFAWMRMIRFRGTGQFLTTQSGGDGVAAEQGIQVDANGLGSVFETSLETPELQTQYFLKKLKKP